MAEEQEVSAMFPVSGLDVTCEYGRQPENTTPEARNVRSYDPASGRSRGGSRSGLTRYIDETVVGVNLIQHLAVLVDPQQPALRFDPTQEYPDPSTNNTRIRVPPGRRVRLGGSAINPRGNDSSGVGTGNAASVRQRIFYSDLTGYTKDPVSPEPPFNSSNSDRNVPLPEDVLPGNALVVAVMAVAPSGTPTVSVTNADLVSYTQVGTYGSSVSNRSLSLWRKTASPVNGPDRTAIVSGPGWLGIAVFEVRSVNFLPSATSTVNHDGSGTFKVGPLAVAADDSFAIVALDSPFDDAISDAISNGFSRDYTGVTGVSLDVIWKIVDTPSVTPIDVTPDVGNNAVTSAVSAVFQND